MSREEQWPSRFDPFSSWILLRKMMSFRLQPIGAMYLFIFYSWTALIITARVCGPMRTRGRKAEIQLKEKSFKAVISKESCAG